MKSTVVVDVDAPAKEVANLFADPSVNVKWMHDIERYEPISGKIGMPGSVYRLFPKSGSMPLTATVVKRFPDQLYLHLEADNVTVQVHGTIKTLENGRTRLVSKENFIFKGVWNKLYGVLTSPAIHKVHRRHLHAFKEFVETRRPPVERSAARKKQSTKRRRSKYQEPDDFFGF